MNPSDLTPAQRVREALIGLIPVFVLVLLVAWLAMRVRGEQFDPNDPVNAPLVSADQLSRQMRNTFEVLDRRATKGEIPEAQIKVELKKRADQIMKRIDPLKISPEDAPIYGDIARTAERWDQSLVLYRSAREVALIRKDEGIKVKYALRVAEALGYNGQADEALKMVRATYDCPDYAKAQILAAVVYEITPACKDKGHNKELQKLIIDAIAQDDLAKVDATSKEGSIFISSRPGRHRIAGRAASDLDITR